jgi:dTDP-glucose 4,6-dehydratase
MILVTGGAGFIGSNFVLDYVAHNPNASIVNLDKLTYAGNLSNLESLTAYSNHHFVHGDIGDTVLVDQLLAQYQPQAIVHFAAESHVDRSIHTPGDFLQTNIVGTFTLLQCATCYWNGLDENLRNDFRFLHVSTDEVFGSLSHDAPAFTETHPYEPNSPYSASKAASDHFVRAWHHTYGLPVLTTNCSNNYGPYQFPEKLIPLVITHALEGRPLPIYGDGQQVRDWLYVSDHCDAIRTVLAHGKIGETYNIGGNAEMTNLSVVEHICLILDELCPKADGSSYQTQITFVRDRPGHDRRYAMNIDKIGRTLDWQPRESFQSGIRKTIQWYLDHAQWLSQVRSGEYLQWLKTHYRP